jgi:hypothetical protein
VGLVVVILLIALLFGGLGLFVEALWWMLVVAGALLLAGFVAGARIRR